MSDPDLPVSPASDPLRHLGAIRRLLELILLSLVVIALYFAKDVVLPILIGSILALTLSPTVRTLERKGIAPPISALALILALGVVVAGGAFVASGPMAELIGRAPQLGEELKAKFVSLASSVDVIRNATDQVDKLTSQTSDQSVQRVTIEAPVLLNAAVSNAATVLSSASVALVLALFILASGDMFYVKLIEAFPKFGDKKRALRIAYGIEQSVARYLLTVTLINAGLGSVVGVAMLSVGMPQPLVWAAAAFLFNFLPYVGPVIGIGLSGAVAVATFPALPHALLVPGLYAAAALLEGQFLTPVVLGRRIQLNTVAMFLTLVFWGWLWGIAGAFMAMPFLVCLKVICDNVEPLWTLGNFLSSSAGRSDVP